jgi:hypothetical protein
VPPERTAHRAAVIGKPRNAWAHRAFQRSGRILRVAITNRVTPKTQTPKQLYEGEAYEDRAYSDWAYNLLDDAVPAFQKQPLVTGS